MHQIYQQVWINLPKEVRNKLVEVFSLERTGVTEIQDQTVKSDGYTNDDLKHITLDKMCAYIGSEETFLRAWEVTLAKVHSELNPPVVKVGEGAVVETVPELTDSDIIDKSEPEVSTPKKSPEPDEPFCLFCAAESEPHLRGCPNYKK